MLSRPLSEVPCLFERSEREDARLTGNAVPRRGSYADHLQPTAKDPDMARPITRRRFVWLLNNTLNRVTRRIARSGHGPFSLIRHIGRKSGRIYETPVILARAPEGFIAELTYGENVNWYRNVVASRGCVVVHHRVQYRVTAVEACSAQRGRSAYPAPFRLVLKALGRNEFRLLRTERSQPPS